MGTGSSGTLAHDLYQVVYDTIRREIARPAGVGRLNDDHRRFAERLPAPDAVDETDAAALCSLVVISGQYGLEAFYGVTDPDTGLPLGDLVRQELPDYQDHLERAKQLVEQYRA